MITVITYFLMGYMLALCTAGGVLWFRAEEESIRDSLAKGQIQGTLGWTGGGLGSPFVLLVLVSTVTLGVLVFVR